MKLFAWVMTRIAVTLLLLIAAVPLLLAAVTRAALNVLLAVAIAILSEWQPNSQQRPGARKD